MKIADIMFRNMIDEIKNVAEMHAQKLNTKRLIPYDSGFRIGNQLSREKISKIDLITVVDQGRQVLIRSNMPENVTTPNQTVKMNKKKFIEEAFPGKIIAGIEMMTREELKEEGFDVPWKNALSITAAVPLHHVQTGGAFYILIVRRIIDLHKKAIIHRLSGELDVQVSIYKGASLIGESRIDKKLPKCSPEMIKRALQPEGSSHPRIIKKDGYICKYLPLYDLNGETAGLLMVKGDIEEYLQAHEFAVNMASIAFITLFILLYSVKIFIDKKIVWPLMNLKKKADSFRLNHYSLWTQTDMMNHLDEIKMLSLSFDDMIKRIEKAYNLLEQKEKMLQSILRATPHGIALVKDDRLKWCNKVFSDILGYPGNEIIGNSFQFFCPQKSDYGVFKESIRSNGGKKVSEYEYHLPHKDGSKIPCFVTGSLLDADDPEKGYILTITDFREKVEAERKIRILNKKLDMSLEQERKKIAYDLHDDIIQDLAAIAVKFGSYLSSKEPETPEKRKMLEEYTALLKENIGKIRAISYGLSPSGLEQFGIFHVLKALAEEYSEKLNIPVAFYTAGFDPEKSLDEELSINIFRIVQEALRNIEKHSEAAHVRIFLLSYYPKMILRIEDDGIGITDQNRNDTVINKQLGIHIMTERVKNLGGEFQIESAPGEGTKIIIELEKKNEVGNNH